MRCFQKNEPVSSLTHFVGFLLAIPALVILVLTATAHGSAWHIVSFSIFGASSIILYLASSIYHIIPRTNKLKEIFRRIDLSFIFILIAGSYTPIALVPLRGPWGWTILGIVWGLALLGVMTNILKIYLKTWVSVCLYLSLGWTIVLAFPILSDNLSKESLAWLFAGGIFYSIGVIFFTFDNIFKKQNRWLSMHDIFHVFVIAGTFSHFWLMYKYIIFYN